VGGMNINKFLKEDQDQAKTHYGEFAKNKVDLDEAMFYGNLRIAEEAAFKLLVAVGKLQELEKRKIHSLLMDGLEKQLSCYGIHVKITLQKGFTE
jgi:hypothetical protein